MVNEKKNIVLYESFLKISNIVDNNTDEPDYIILQLMKDKEIKNFYYQEAISNRLIRIVKVLSHLYDIGYEDGFRDMENAK